MNRKEFITQWVLNYTSTFKAQLKVSGKPNTAENTISSLIKIAELQADLAWTELQKVLS